jgi:hypothetical protein
LVNAVVPTAAIAAAAVCAAASQNAEDPQYLVLPNDLPGFSKNLTEIHDVFLSIHEILVYISVYVKKRRGLRKAAPIGKDMYVWFPSLPAGS